MTELQNIGTYRGLTLDPFQQEALQSIDENYSVLVAAPTGVGKTLIADYLIEKTYKAGGRVVYTAPIKALSNQKYKEFKAHMGEDVVGILTGDVVINPDAPVLIMTTEIFRNLLQLSPERVSDVHYVIFDEIHYIDDPQRGSVWEESLIFMPESMRFLGLSATIPNVDQLASWIETIHNQEIKVVTHFERVVPLKHYLFEASLGVTTMAKLRKKYNRIASKIQDNGAGWSKDKELFPRTSHLDLIKTIKDDYLPCLFFTFSRRKCEMNALELGSHFDFLTIQQKKQVEKIVQSVAERYPNIASDRWENLRRLVLRGIGYHHAGMLPALKDVVEELFTHRLIPVLYCTETFAVGLNFPCKTVCFDSTTKWDGVSFRAITNREYFQMAGRAGRRGIDEEGFAFSLVDLKFFDPREFPSMKESQIEPLQSQFSLTYNSVLNLVKNYDEEDIYRILGKNFATYQASAERDQLRDKLGELETEIDQFCEHLNLEACPIVYDRMQRKSKRYESQLATTDNGQHKRRIHRQLQAIDKTLSNVNREECTPQQQRECRRQGKVYQKLVRRFNKLIKREKSLDSQQRYIQEFLDKKSLLEALGYLEDDKLTSAGLFASQIHGQELLVTELFFDGLFQNYDVHEINAIAVSIGYEPRKNEVKLKHKINLAPVYKAMYFISSMEERFLGQTTVEFNDHIAVLAYRWSKGEAFADLMNDSQIDEGDLVFAFRRGVDLLRQVRNATNEDKYLNAKLRECHSRMDRDEVSIWL